MARKNVNRVSDYIPCARFIMFFNFIYMLLFFLNLNRAHDLPMLFKDLYRRLVQMRIDLSTVIYNTVA